MARLPRLVLPGYMHHVMQCGHDRGVIVRDDEDRQFYLNFLSEIARAERVAVHAYVLMDDHVHLLVTPENDTGLSRMMQSLGRRYVKSFNQKYGRTGTLWEGRFRGGIVEAQRYAVPVMVFIESNPVRRDAVGQAQDYVWSSAAHHLGLRRDPLITEHEGYWALGNTPFDRQAAYRRLLVENLPLTEIKAIGEFARKNWALGSESFIQQAQQVSQRPMQPRPRGRPAKKMS